MGKGLLFKHAEIIDLLELWSEIGNIKFINNTQSIRQRLAYKLHLKGHPRRSWNNVSLKMGKLRKSFEKCNQHNRQCVFNGNHPYRCRYYAEMSRFLPSHHGDIETAISIGGLASEPGQQKLMSILNSNGQDFKPDMSMLVSNVMIENKTMQQNVFNSEDHNQIIEESLQDQNLKNSKPLTKIFSADTVKTTTQRINSYPIPETSTALYTGRSNVQLVSEHLTSQYDDDLSVESIEAANLSSKKIPRVDNLVSPHMTQPVNIGRTINPPQFTTGSERRQSADVFRTPDSQRMNRIGQTPYQRERFSLSRMSDSSGGGIMDKEDRPLNYRIPSFDENLRRRSSQYTSIDITNEFSDSRRDLIESMKINQHDSNLDRLKQQDNLLEYYRKRDEIESRDRGRDRILREADIRLREKELRFREHVEKESERRHQELLSAIINRM